MMLCVGEMMTDGERPVWFWNWTSGWDTRTSPWPKSRRHSMRKITPQLISTVAPKHAGYLGSLRTDLWLKKCMQSERKREQAGSCQTEDNKLTYYLITDINRKIEKTAITMCIEEFLVWAVVWVSCYALHPPFWDAMTWWASCKATH